MPASDWPRCQCPGCDNFIRQLGTGRPGKYCKPECRVAHWRARRRALDAERRRADQLAAALATTTCTRQQLQHDTDQAVRVAAEITAHAGAGAIPDLNRALADWRDLARRIEATALEHATAAARVRHLTTPAPGS
jgi:hypothetical protein